MDRVFICYSRQDTAFVDQLGADLQAAGVPTWRDVDDIPGHIGASTQSWRDAVQEGLRLCNHMIVVVSPDSVDSAEVKAEWNYFLRHGKRVHPVFHRDCDMPYRLFALQWWDFREEYDQPLEGLLGVLPDVLPYPYGEAVIQKITPSELEPELVEHFEPESPPSRSRSTMHLPWAWIGGIGAVVIVGIIGLVAWLGGRTEPPATPEPTQIEMATAVEDSEPTIPPTETDPTTVPTDEPMPDLQETDAPETEMLPPGTIVKYFYRGEIVSTDQENVKKPSNGALIVRVVDQAQIPQPDI